MWRQLIEDNQDFEMFSVMHFIPVFIMAVGGYLIIRKGLSFQNREDKLKLAFLWSLPGPVLILGWMLFRYYTGTFSKDDDIPVHLCNFVTVIIPFYFLHPDRKLFGILYFWVMVGTFQALLTPSLEQGFPHFWYFRYWIIHCGLIILILYAIIVLGERPGWADFKRAFIATNIYAIFTLLVNFTIDSNYFFTMKKPETASLLDYLGPWPWYLVTGQLVMGIMFTLYLLPFTLVKQQSAG